MNGNELRYLVTSPSFLEPVAGFKCWEDADKWRYCNMPSGKVVESDSAKPLPTLKEVQAVYRNEPNYPHDFP